MDERQQRGRSAEALAETHLKAHGLREVARNYRCRQGELDLVMRDGTTLVFVEVRYRRRDRFGSGAESVDRRKQARLIAAAQHYLQRHGGNRAARFDVISVSGDPAAPQVAWIRDAFQA